MSSASRSSEPRRRVLGLLAAAGLLLAASGAWAQGRPLDGPRAAGQVGERFDGYAVIRGTASADLAALVDRVNGERKALYQQRAAADHAPVDQVGRVYAQEILKAAPAGTWFLQENGQWVQK